MIKFLKVLFQKLFERKKSGKSIAKFLNKKKKEGTLPPGVDIQEVRKGTYRISATNELSFNQIVDIIENFTNGGKSDD